MNTVLAPSTFPVLDWTSRHRRMPHAIIAMFANWNGNEWT